MESNRNIGDTLKDLTIQRKVSVAIIFGGLLAMSMLIATVGLFVKQDKSLMLSVLVVATIMAIIPSVLKLIKINALLKTRMQYFRS
ncbi:MULTISPECIES: hypothetical protein [Sphingobacterium]|uniref:Uncharacterized protein n=1 Tax=Sphingobacterium cellulitidis TaxID=1768011 RepID=A0A8H9FYG5_9SPHI|nr:MULTISPECIES: hypothetical protein [Sphingobacterium]MBA8985278.1 FtsH-binding integral membrane protein [Sphingobacterium soli]OYD41472.1 hypothetical protein CHT99_12445 [Sphingobacterium cellulitidis]OYD45605.1 hypothetical protein CHU00_11635 [Sphingobacterium cellulitidis]WFB63702.1 hypothetical protein PZ892_00510 [Sphingobacterium sp. WM]GGE10897.1 hypothetical protein GCM10011516_05800 [Sphingobacterium soli]